MEFQEGPTWAQSEIICRVIFQHLFNKLFNVWLPGASRAVHMVLELLEEGLTQLERKKGQYTLFKR